MLRKGQGGPWDPQGETVEITLFPNHGPEQRRG